MDEKDSDFYDKPRTYLEFEEYHVKKAKEFFEKAQSSKYSDDKLKNLEKAYEELFEAHLALKMAVKEEEHKKGISFEELAKIFSEKANMRIRLLAALVSRYEFVTPIELEKFTGVQIATVSDNLKKLQNLGLLDTKEIKTSDELGRKRTLTAYKISEKWRETILKGLKNAYVALLG